MIISTDPAEVKIETSSVGTYLAEPEVPEAEVEAEEEEAAVAIAAEAPPQQLDAGSYTYWLLYITTVKNIIVLISSQRTCSL